MSLRRPSQAHAGRAGAGGRPVGRAIPALAFATGTVVTIEFIVIGLLPLLARDLALALPTAGWLVSGFALAGAVLGPPATLLAARVPPAAVLAWGMAGFALTCLLAALWPSFALLLVLRLVQGALLTPLVSVASAAAASLMGPGRAGLGIGRIYLGTVLGMVLAVPAGVALAELIGWRPVFAGLAALSLASGGLLLATMPGLAAERPPSLAAQLVILRRPGFLLHLACSALVFTALFASYSYIAAFFADALGLSAAAAAAMLLAFGLAGIAGNELATRRVDRRPSVQTALVTLLLMVATTALSLAQPGPWPALPLILLWGGAHAAMFLICQVRVMAAAPDAPAFAGALNIALANAGIAAGAVLGGWVVATAGVALVGLGTLAAGALALAVTLLILHRERVPAGHAGGAGPAAPRLPGCPQGLAER